MERVLKRLLIMGSAWTCRQSITDYEPGFRVIMISDSGSGSGKQTYALEFQLYNIVTQETQARL